MTIKESKEKDLQEVIEKAKETKALSLIIEKVRKVTTDKETPLKGVPYVVTTGISTKGIVTTASSDLLKDYVPTYDATVIKKLKESGSILIAKSDLDELDLGYESSYFGAADAVASGIVPFAIASESTYSVRKRAAQYKIVGFKPTYGLISRYGLFPMSASLDHIGILSKSLKDTTTLIDHLKGYDPKDMTSLVSETSEWSEDLGASPSGKKLFYIKELVDSLEDKEELKRIITICIGLGIEVEGVSIDSKLLEVIISSHKAILSAEATSATANLTGIIYGTRGQGETIEEIILDARTKGLSDSLKRRLVMGSYVLAKENQDKLFLNAKRVRGMIVAKITHLFDQYDAMIHPVTIKSKQSDTQLLIATLGGFPSIVIPGIEQSSISLTGAIRKDKEILQLAYALERALGKEGSEKDV